MADRLTKPPERDFDFVRVAINDVIDRMEQQKSALTEDLAIERVNQAIKKLQSCRDDLQKTVFMGPMWFMIFFPVEEPNPEEGERM